MAHALFALLAAHGLHRPFPVASLSYYAHSSATCPRPPRHSMPLPFYPFVLFVLPEVLSSGILGFCTCPLRAAFSLPLDAVAAIDALHVFPQFLNEAALLNCRYCVAFLPVCHSTWVICFYESASYNLRFPSGLLALRFSSLSIRFTTLTYSTTGFRAASPASLLCAQPVLSRPSAIHLAITTVFRLQHLNLAFQPTHAIFATHRRAFVTLLSFLPVCCIAKLY